MSEQRSWGDDAERFLSAVESYGGGQRDADGRLVVDCDDVIHALKVVLTEPIPPKPETATGKVVSEWTLDEEEVEGTFTLKMKGLRPGTYKLIRMEEKAP